MKYDYAVDCVDEMIDYIYDHFDEFTLLLKCSYGNEASDFINRLVNIEVEYTIKFIQSIGNDAIEKERANKTFLKIVQKAYFSVFF